MRIDTIAGVVGIGLAYPPGCETRLIPALEHWKGGEDRAPLDVFRGGTLAPLTKSLHALLSALYLAGVSTSDFQDVLAALLGKDAPNLSPAVISRLKGEWDEDYSSWQARDLAARRYVYLWVDGVYLQVRMEPQPECMRVLIGAMPEGEKELAGFQTSIRESAQSWKEVLVDLKKRGLLVEPEIASAPARSVQTVLPSADAAAV